MGHRGISGTSSRTVSAWIKTSTIGTVVSWGNKFDCGNQWTVRLQNSTGFIQISVKGGNIKGSTDLRDDSWHHIAAVLEDDGSPNADEIKLYVDGEEEAVSAYDSQAIDTVRGAGVLIGAVFSDSIPALFLTGMIDDVRIYDRALSPDNILRIYEETEPTQIICPDVQVGDLNGDCRVDNLDISIFAMQWLWAG
jgi:hypothetical protein